MNGWYLALTLGVLGSPIPPPDPAVPFDNLADAERVAIGSDSQKRMTVAVRIGDSAPLRFVIDTAAQRTVLTRELAERLNLPPNDRVRVVTLGGTQDVSTVIIPALTLGIRSYTGLLAPTFPSANLAVDGVLGLDSLQHQRVMFDFAGRSIAILDSDKALRSRNEREIVVRARNRSGQLILTQARIDGIAVNVIIDTGGELSIGNLALMRRLRLKEEALRPTVLTDISGHRVPAGIGVIDTLEINAARISQLTVGFADIEPFRALGLLERPALFLGMNALRQFERVAIDFESRRVFLAIPDRG